MPSHRDRSLPTLLRGSSDASVSEVLATVLLTAMTVVLVGGFGMSVLSTVATTGGSVTGSFSLDADVRANDTATGSQYAIATLVAGTSFRLDDARLIILRNDTAVTGNYSLMDDAGRWAAGGRAYISLVGEPLTPDDRVTLLVVHDETNKLIGRTTRTILSAATQPAYFQNAVSATASLSPAPLPADARTVGNLSVNVTSTFGLDLVQSVSVNLTPVGGRARVELQDDGQGADALAADGIFTTQLTVSSYPFATSGNTETVVLVVNVTDVFGRGANATLPLVMSPPTPSKVVSGATWTDIPGSASIGWLNLTNFTFRDATKLDNDQVELRVSDLGDFTKSWTALVTFNYTRCGFATVESVTLTRDYVAGRTTLQPTDLCGFDIGSNASLNLVTFAASRDNATPANNIVWSGSAGDYEYAAAGISDDNEVTITFLGDRLAQGVSEIGLGQTNLTWGRKGSLTNATAASEPRTLTALRGNASVTLSWVSPLDGGGAAITDYRLYYGTSPGSYSTNFLTGSTSTSRVVTGLQNGIVHYFAVAAINAAGEGAKSNEASVAPGAVPGAPLDFVTTAGAGYVNLTWRAPDYVGGFPVSAYTIYMRAGSNGTTTLLETIGTNTWYEATGLVNGTTYYFQVTAWNAIGESEKSEIHDATPAAPPGASTLSAAAHNQSVQLTWTAAASNGGTVTNYNIYNLSSGSAIFHAAVGNVLSYNATGLANGYAYSFAVSANNSLGEGSRSNTVAATPADRPAPVVGLAAAAGDAQVTLNWSLGADNGAALTGHRIYQRDGTGVEFLARTIPGGNTSTVMTGLSNGVAYAFNVTAVNAMGESVRSAVSATPTSGATAPSSPQSLAATPSNEQVALTWSAPSSDGGSAITSYRVYRGTTSGLTLLTTIGTNTTFADHAVSNNVTYHYQVSAVNAAGEGARTAEVSATPSPNVSVNCGTATTSTGSIDNCSSLQFADLVYATLAEGSGSAKTFSATFSLNVTGVIGPQTLEINGVRNNAPEDLWVQAFNHTTGNYETVATLLASYTTATTFSGSVYSTHHWPTGVFTIRLIDAGPDPNNSSWNVDYVRLVTT